MYEPPFDPTDKITATALDIAEMVGRLAPDSALSSSPVLHRELRIKTIHSSLAIEQNTLTMEQVTDIIDGRRVFGPPDDIREVRNAKRAYDLLRAYSITSSNSSTRSPTETAASEGSGTRCCWLDGAPCSPGCRSKA